MDALARSLSRGVEMSRLIDALIFAAVGWIGAILLLPLGQWIEYKRLCKRYGKEQANEIWRRWR